jgi:hypothetical protein
MRAQHDPTLAETRSNAPNRRKILLGGSMLAAVSALGSTAPIRLAQLAFLRIDFPAIGVSTPNHNWLTRNPLASFCRKIRGFSRGRAGYGDGLGITLTLCG